MSSYPPSVRDALASSPNGRSLSASEPSIEGAPAVGGDPSAGVDRAARRPGSGKVTTDSAGSAGQGAQFVPRVPRSLDEAGLTTGIVQNLVLKYLYQEGAAIGRKIAEHLALPFRLLEDPLRQLKDELLVVYKASGPLGDYVYELTSSGAKRAQRYCQDCTYCGAAPVSLEDYVASVGAQSVRMQRPRSEDVRGALSGLLLSEALLEQIGLAINCGLGFFLSGAPGNGKTTIAQRVTRAYGEAVWVPRAIHASGEIIRVFDARVHDEIRIGAETLEELQVDRRWVCIRRPTIVVGGELTLDSLEITKNPATGINEAPVQLKSNCGTLVVDDFGRQRISASEMLNRWIVPLETRCDYLAMSNGRKLQVPFDQLVVFSSNLDPASLADEAFLRRIPYKIRVEDPTEDQFRQLVQLIADRKGMTWSRSSVDYLMQKAYGTGRERRFCHAEALLSQIATLCDYRGLPLSMTAEATDLAIGNYFATS